MEGLQGAGSWELGVFPEDLCHKGGHVSLFGVVQGKERVFLPRRAKETSADTKTKHRPPGDVTQLEVDSNLLPRLPQTPFFS